MIPLQNLITVDNLSLLAYDFNYKIYSNKLNIWGIRTPQGEFNDWFIYFWKVGNKWEKILTLGTTEPGQGYLNRIMGNKNGTAVLVHNRQYIDCWEIGKHHGKYDALCQIYGYQFAVWRDSNKNGRVDYEGRIYDDAQGINNHSTRLGYAANYIGNFSAGCQVIWSWKVFEEIMRIAKERNEKRYSYTLVTEDYVRLYDKDKKRVEREVKNQY